MRFVSIVATLAVVASCTAASAEETSYGKGLRDAQEVKVSELAAHPDQYVGKTVRVEGVVVDVCPKRGCWMDIANDGESTKVRIKVDDGAIVFPVGAKGSHAVAEGVFTKIEMSPEEANAYAKHLEKERGQALDVDTAAIDLNAAKAPTASKAPKAPKAPTVIYQIQGTGAVIN